jgi:opacity protein-like surface antigen
MKSKLPLTFLPLFFTNAFGEQGLYYTGTEAQESLPIKWLVGGNVIYDDNVNPTSVDPSTGRQSAAESSMAVNPYVGASFVNLSPQTTLDVYGKLGMVYYFDAPDGINEINSQSRASVNLIHRFSERVRFVSRNFVANELEPDYSYGMASSRQSGEFLSWSTDNSLGYRWTERFGTYTGVRLNGSSYDDSNSDRTSWQFYEQLRYQYSPQTVLVTEYRYGQTLTNGDASESDNQYFLIGADHRFSPNTIGTVRTGAQLRDVDGGSSSTSPYLEFALNSQINPQLKLGAFMRYGMEDDDTVLTPDPFITERFNYDERSTFRLGVTGTYLLSPDLSLNSGVDLIQSDYDSGRLLSGGAPGTNAPSRSETTFNAYIGMSVKLTEYLYGNLSYNYSQVVSDVNDYREYDRNRVSVGVSAEF